MVRARAKRGEGDRLRDEIVEAGKRLLFETGDEEAVTIRAVARAVGVSPPSIYLHFADKNALLLAVCEATFDALDDHIEKAAAGIDDLGDELRARGKAYVRFGLDNPEQYRILFMTRPVGLEPDAAIPATAAFDHHLDAIQRAADAGLFVEGTDPLLAALTVWAGVHGVTSLLIAKPTFTWPDLDVLIDGVLSTLVRGLSR
ncbi:MAG: regulatory protein TetR [Acidimicrobiales bacterium]|nr:regulatory protein TetR [Acidimicrobiales bacterium]